MAKMILFSHPTLNENAKALINGLLRNKILAKIYTCVAVFEGQLLYKLSKHSKLKDLKRRNLDSIWQPFTHSRSLFEFGRLIASKFHLQFLVKHEKGFFCIDKIYQKHDKWVANNLIEQQKKGAIGVYAYEDGALATFTKAKEIGLDCLYDLPIGYWRSARLLMQKEFDLNPEWSETLTGFNDSYTKLNNKDQELALADIIFVASSFTKKTLESYPGNLPEIKVIPYGFPDVKQKKIYESLDNRKLKVLFIGGLSQRKGLSYLFDAVEGMQNEVELTIVGQKSVANCNALNSALEQHQWIRSLSHEQILTCMQQHDVLVFPSLFEGFGLVITEAMSQGIPVITTNRTAGPDIIKDRVDGWIVEAASSSAIKTVLKQIIKEPVIIKKLGLAAQKKAKARPWSVYGQEMADALKSLKKLKPIE